MEQILEIIYNYSRNNKILDLDAINKMIELIVDTRDLNNFVIGININSENSMKLASYCNYSKVITINKNMIQVMLNNIDNKIFINNDFEKTFYKNISILQVLLHELEHAYQEKIIYSENSLEAFIIRLSYMIEIVKRKDLYEQCPYERLAEIKSFDLVNLIVNLEKNKLKEVSKFLKNKKLRRLLRGYKCLESYNIQYPIENYFISYGRQDLLNSFDWYSDNDVDSIKSCLKNYNLYDRYKYGFPITVEEYATPMKKIILFYEQNYKEL